MTSPESRADTSDDLRTEKPEGERWLEILGEGHLIGTLIPHFREGKQLYAEEFPLICGSHARPAFKALENMDPSNPKREEYLEAARATLHYYLSQSAEELS